MLHTKMYTIKAIHLHYKNLQNLEQNIFPIPRDNHVNIFFLLYCFTQFKAFYMHKI